MTKEEALELKTGDSVRCTECPTLGCTGKPQKVTVEKADCGCLQYLHEGNGTPFLSDPTACRLLRTESIGFHYGVTGEKISKV